MVSNSLNSESLPSGNNEASSVLVGGFDHGDASAAVAKSSITAPPGDDGNNIPNMSSSGTPPTEGFSLTRPFAMDRSRTQQISMLNTDPASPSLVRVDDASPASNMSGMRGRERQRDGSTEPAVPVRCINPASEINARLDTQVEVRVYPCNNSQGGGKKKFTTFTIKPEVSSKVLLRRVSDWSVSAGASRREEILVPLFSNPTCLLFPPQ